jgi:hypothetical protein
MELASEREAKFKVLGAKNEAEYVQKVESAMDELKKHVSPSGSLFLPELLDKKRVAHGIPDEAFAIQAAYDIVYLSQLPSSGGDKFFEGGILVRPDTKRSYDDKTNPKAVIVSAGLAALDALRSHGMDLGHTVYFQKLAPFRLEYASIGGLTYHFIVVTASDITGSVDLMDNIRTGKLGIELDDHGQHVYWDTTNNAPFISRIDVEKEDI